MRYQPSTDRARSIESIAAECSQAVASVAPFRYVAQPQDVFAAESCRIWALCRESAQFRGDRAKVEQLDGYLAVDLHRAMHHRPHQSEF
jgi:hypothetical protein